MTPEQFETEIQEALWRAMMNTDAPRPKTMEEADAVHDQLMLRMFGLIAEQIPTTPKPNHVRDAVNANR